MHDKRQTSDGSIKAILIKLKEGTTYKPFKYLPFSLLAIIQAIPEPL